MPSSGFSHPVLRHVALVACLLCAAATVFASALLNPHSVAWLLGIYLTTGLFLYVWRIRAQARIMKPFLLYLAMVNQYFLCVWLLHVWVPGRDPEKTAPDVLYWAHVVDIGSIFVPVAIYHFAIRLAEIRARIIHALEWIGWGAACYILYLKSIDQFTVAYFWCGFTWVPTNGGKYAQYMEYVTFYCLAAIFIPAVRMFTLKDRRKRLQVLYFVTGFGLWVLTCMAHMLITLGVNLYPFGGIAFLFHITLLAYAMLHKRLFDTTVIVRTGLVYALMSACFGALFGVLVWASATFLAPDAANIWALTPFAVLAGLLFGPLLGALQLFIDRRFRRLLQDRGALLEAHAREIAFTLELEPIAAAVCKTLYQGTGARSAAFYAPDEHGGWRVRAVYPAAPASEGDQPPPRVAQALAGAPARPQRLALEIAAFEPARAASEGAAPLALATGNEHLLLPVRHRNETVAAVLLGPKASDDAFYEEDLRFAEAIAAQSSLALANARSYASLRHLREMTAQTLEGLTAGVLLLDGAQRIVVWNRAARRLFYRDDPSAAAIPPALADLKSSAPQLAEVLAQAAWDVRNLENVELKIESPKAQTLLLSTKVLGDDAGTPLLLVLLHDVTEYKAMEQVLRRQEGLARLGQLIATINHEVRNILQPVRLQFESLRGDVATSEKGRRHLAAIQNRLQTLDEMLAGLKNLARPLDLRKRAFDLRPLLEAVCADLRAANENGPAVRLSVAPEAERCFGDGTWLRQAFYNLARNALEATEGQESRQVEVLASATPSHLTITVRDNGWGISEHGLERIFEPFYSTKGSAGTGLGLAITRKIVEAHGGTLTVWSQQGMGSRFTVELPRAELEAATPASD